MLFSLIILVLIAAIAYIHYLQGAFSATLSAVCAVFAAVLAFGYHETVVATLLAGRAADFAHGLVLIGLFALIYTLLRVAFDAFIPGNVRLPVMVDKVLAAGMGVVAGLFCMGVFAVAAQLLPFGPSIGGYARLETDAPRSVQVSIPGISQAQDLYTYNELIENRIEPEKQQGLWIPVDDLLVGLVYKLSAGGSLAGTRPLASVHPDYLLQLFGQRMGIQVGAKRVIFSSDASPAATLGGLYRLPSAVQVQGELTQIRNHQVPAEVKPSPDELLLVVRTRIDPSSAGDSRDRKVRLSLGSVRLNAVDADGRAHNHWPIGTLEEGSVLVFSKPDDFLVMPSNKSAVDFVFRLRASDVLRDPGAARTSGGTITDGTFLEVKRMARVDLSGQTIAGAPPRSPDVGLQWKQPTTETIARARGVGGMPTVAGPFEPRGQPRVSDQLLTPVNVGTGDTDNNNVTFNGGTASLVNRRFRSFDIDGSRAIAMLAAGEYTVQQLSTPDGRRIVQITGTPQREDPWKWGDVGKFDLTDSTGGTHRPVGAWARVIVGTAQHFLGAYNADRGVSDIPQIDGRPTEVTLAFAVPPGVTITALRFEGRPIAALSFEVP